jgi:hypothetical protein
MDLFCIISYSVVSRDKCCVCVHTLNQTNSESRDECERKEVDENNREKE